MDASREFLRHTLATLAYRGGKALRGAPAVLGGFSAGSGSRNAGEILAHVGDVLDWALAVAGGQQTWRDSKPLPWEREVARFHAALQALDDYLASDAPLGVSAQQLFQGPIADALTHIGQIALLRRLAATPVAGENYLKADIAVGRLGPEQAEPRRDPE